MSVNTLLSSPALLSELSSAIGGGGTTYLYKGIFTSPGGGNADNVTVAGAKASSVCLATMGNNDGSTVYVVYAKYVAADTVQIRYSDLAVAGYTVNLVVF